MKSTTDINRASLTLQGHRCMPNLSASEGTHRLRHRAQHFTGTSRPSTPPNRPHQRTVTEGPRHPLRSSTLTKTSLIFPGFGDIHIHAREDASGHPDTTRKTSAPLPPPPSTAASSHVADMPNNIIAPVDDDRWLTPSAPSRKPHRTVHVTLYAGIGPHTSRRSARNVPVQSLHGPVRRRSFLHARRPMNLRAAIARYAGCNVSFHCEDPVSPRQPITTAPTHEASNARAEAELAATDFALLPHRKVCPHHQALPLLHRAMALPKIRAASVSRHARYR